MCNTRLYVLLFFYVMCCVYPKSYAKNDLTQAPIKKTPSATKQIQQDILPINDVLVMSITSSINPATYSYLASGYEKAKKEHIDLILIKLNTPGGLVSTTKKILTLIGSHDIITTIWVSPEGASATSAGAIIAAGSHLLFMANGTNIGAATPIDMSTEQLNNDLRSKAINDLVALVSSLAETRGRNTEMFAKMIAEAASYTSTEAHQNKLIDGIANDYGELLKKINTKQISLRGKQVLLQATNPNITHFEMDAGQKLLNIFADPNMAYILFVLGAALLYIEFQALGGFIAGAIGIICLLLAGIGFQILPLNFGAFALIILAFVLFIVELFVTSFGLISLAGIASLVTGSLFLFRTDDAYIQISNALIFTTSGIIGLFVLFLGLFIFRDMKKHKTPSNYYALKNKKAVILSIEKKEPTASFYYYQVRVAGEIWRAKSSTHYHINDTCDVKEEPSPGDLTLLI